jgi:hypothetical protein
MNEFYTKFYQKQKNSETIKKNITKEMKSNPIIYDRNPTYMNFQSDIFYTPESSLNVYTSYNDAYYNYDYYNSSKIYSIWYIIIYQRLNINK